MLDKEAKATSSRQRCQNVHKLKKLKSAWFSLDVSHLSCKALLKQQQQTEVQENLRKNNLVKKDNQRERPVTKCQKRHCLMVLSPLDLI